MTVDVWERMTPNIILGLRNINKYIAANPQWWVLEIFDGFGAHLLSHKANEERFAAKILSLKEEGYTSHVCQAYDKHVAKGDNAVKSLSLSFLRIGFKVSNLSLISGSLSKSACLPCTAQHVNAGHSPLLHTIWTPACASHSANGVNVLATSSNEVNHSFRRHLMPIHKYIMFMQCYQHGGMS
jgi:intracellular sulfur oxidation DsrE/DsrF family protein